MAGDAAVGYEEHERRSRIKRIDDEAISSSPSRAAS